MGCLTRCLYSDSAALRNSENDRKENRKPALERLRRPTHNGVSVPVRRYVHRPVTKDYWVVATRGGEPQYIGNTLALQSSFVAATRSGELPEVNTPSIAPLLQLTDR